MDGYFTCRKYADAVAAILSKLMPPEVVRVVKLPELPDHGVIADWVDAQADVDPRELRRQVEALADQAEAIPTDRPAASIERFQPFPTAALPEPTRSLVISGVNSIGCDPAMIALPLLADLASAIGTKDELLAMLRTGDFSVPLAPIVETSVLADGKWYTIFDTTNDEYDRINEVFDPPMKCRAR